MPVELFLYVLRLTQLQDPTILFTEDEQMPVKLCSSIKISLRCTKYEDGIDSTEVMNNLLTLTNGPVLIHGYQLDLSRQLETMHSTLFSGPRLWLMPLDYEQNIQLRLDSRFFFYDKTKSGNYTVYEGYAVKGSKHLTPLFEWSTSKTDHINVFEKESVLKRRSDLTGVVLTSDYSAELRPFVRYIRDSSGAIVKTDGYYADIITDLEDYFKFTIKRVASESGWGIQLNNGSWTGLMGQFIDKKIDMAQPFGISLQRLPFVTFCWPLIRGGFTLITNAPTKPKLDMWAYLNIFPVIAWVVGCITIIISSLLFALVNHETIWQGLALQLRLFLQLGYDFPTRGKAVKILLLTSTISFLLIFTYFTCDLTANMTSAPSPIGIKNFQDVIDEDYEVVTFGKSFAVDYFKNAPDDSAMKWVWENKMLTKDPPENALTASYQDMFRVINSQEKTLIYHDPMTYSDEPHWGNLHALKDVEERSTFYVTIAMTKDSEFFELINYYILKMQESGLDARLKRRWMYDAKSNYEGIQAVALTAENLIFTFGILGLGIFVAAICVACEWLVRKCQGSQINRVKKKLHDREVHKISSRNWTK